MSAFHPKQTFRGIYVGPCRASATVANGHSHLMNQFLFGAFETSLSGRHWRVGVFKK